MKHRKQVKLSERKAIPESTKIGVVELVRCVYEGIRRKDKGKTARGNYLS